MARRAPLLSVSPVPVFLLSRGGFALAFALYATVANLRRAVELGFDPLELVLVGTVLEASVFLLEVPTGVVADVHSRRRSVIVGYALVGLGFLLEGFATGLAGVMACQVLWGGGHTFVSGARSAWLADEVGEATAARLQLRAARWSQGAGLAGIAGAAVLGSLALALPMQAAGLVLIATAGFLLACMPEEGFAPRPPGERRSFAAMGRTLVLGARQVRRRPVLVTLLAIALLSGAASEGIDRLRELHFVEGVGLPDTGWPLVWWFAGMQAALLGLGLVAVTVVGRRVDPADLGRLPRVLGGLEALLVAAVLGFAWAGSFAWALAAYLATSVLRQVEAPLFAAWTNRRLDPRSRATVLSLVAQSDALGQVAGGPLLGAIGRGLGVRAALSAAALMLAPVVGLLALAARHGEPEETDASGVSPPAPTPPPGAPDRSPPR